jgi:hypothetical protein
VTPHTHQKPQQLNVVMIVEGYVQLEVRAARKVNDEGED